MPQNLINILFLADSHLGFDLPMRPRIERRRRGYDFFANYQSILDLAQPGNFDLLIHGGDMFFRARIPPLIVDKALEPLVEVANRGIPVYIVPGNHERSKIPLHLFLGHENIFVFDKPKTLLFRAKHASIALSGFPFARKIEGRFHDLIEQTGFSESEADVRLLCIHQAVEGAQVGPKDFTFRNGPDVIPGVDIPGDFSAILSGHIHRSQHLTHDLDKRRMAAPVIYPGSIERTSFAERFEEKHFVTLQVDPQAQNKIAQVKFHKLATRPMVKLEFPAHNQSLESLTKSIRNKLRTLDVDSIVRIQLNGSITKQVESSMTASYLRSIAPDSMNISLAYTWGRAAKHPAQ